MKKIAIYLTNTDRSEFAARQESDALKVVARLKGAGAEYDFTIFDVVMGEFPPEPTSFDGVIITGSPAYVEEGDEWISHLIRDIQTLVAAKTPLIGLCFGHQAIVAALGGKVDRKDFWIFGGTEMHLADHRNWMRPAATDIKLYAANKAQVAELPDGFDLLGGSDICPIGLAALGDHVFTTQFHPEMDDRFIAELVDEYADYLGPEVTAKSRASIIVPAEGALFGQWMRNFIDLERGKIA